MTQYTLFETVIGWAGVAWGDKGLVGVHLPDASPDIARRSFLRKFPDATEAEPTPAVAKVIADIRELMAGKPVDLLDAEIDIARVPEFSARVYAIARAIPPGETLTYGEIATRLGDKLLARDVGAAMGANPWPIVVPCHRVTAAGGKLGGFSARGGANTKLKLLTIEGAAIATASPPAPKRAKAQAPPQADLFG
jgi:methylated-DNA-[protein]-cysteine S-methyltransferase